MLQWFSSFLERRQQYIITSTGAEWIFEDFLSLTFFLFFHIILFCFDHADYIAVLASSLQKRNRQSLDTQRPSSCSDRNEHTEVQHLLSGSPALLDRFLQSRPRQLPRQRATVLHGHSILHDRLLGKKEKEWHRDNMRLANEIF